LSELRLYERVVIGDFEAIKNCQRERIHKYGVVYPPGELLRRSLRPIYN
jgi:carboxypeptidase Taq